MNYILGLVPYSKFSSQNSICPWHFVIFDKWYNTHRMFPWKWETSLVYLPIDDVFYFHCYWLKSNSYDSNDPNRFSKFWYPFWNKNRGK